MNHHFRTFVSTAFTTCLLTTFLISGDRIAAKSPPLCRGRNNR